jgi:uncharacterized repeat protein (TIGR01451 family)
MLDNCDLNVWLVVGNVGGGDDIFVGTADDDWVDDGGYSQSVFDLTPLLPAAAPGVPVRIGFQYHGNDGFDIYIDDILLDSLATADITWLSATPITGTLTSLGGEQVIQVAFDANVVEAYQPGDYAAQLKVVSDDPVNGILSIPVTMTVLALEYGVDLSGDLTGQDIPGETVKYTLTVTNTSEGPSDSFAISFGPHNWFSSSPAGVVGPLEQGESAQFQVEVRIPASAAGGDQEELLVTATSVADPGKTDTATLTTRVESPLADLELDGSVSSSTVWAGVPVTYTLVVTNRGPTKAPHVVLTDVLPAGAVYAWDDGGCSVMGGVLSCELGSMPVRGVRSIEVVIWPLSLSLMVNQAFITAEADDPDRSNNWSTLWTVVEGYLFYFPIMFR